MRPTGTPERRSKRRDAAQRLREQGAALVGAEGAGQLQARVVVAVDDQRQAIAALAEQARRRRMREPAVEGHRRERDVVVVEVGLAHELAVGQVAVGRPVQVGVVEQQARPERRRAPSGLGAHRPHEVDERGQRQEAPVAQAVAQGSSSSSSAGATATMSRGPRAAGRASQSASSPRAASTTSAPSTASAATAAAAASRRRCPRSRRSSGAPCPARGAARPRRASPRPAGGCAAPSSATAVRRGRCVGDGGGVRPDPGSSSAASTPPFSLASRPTKRTGKASSSASKSRRRACRSLVGTTAMHFRSMLRKNAECDPVLLTWITPLARRPPVRFAASWARGPTSSRPRR